MGGWFQDDSSTLHLLCTVFLLLLHQLHLKSPGIRSWRLGTPVLQPVSIVWWRRGESTQHTECVLGLILGSKMRKAQVKDYFFTRQRKSSS